MDRDYGPNPNCNQMDKDCDCAISVSSCAINNPQCVLQMDKDCGDQLSVEEKWQGLQEMRQNAGNIMFVDVSRPPPSFVHVPPPWFVHVPSPRFSLRSPPRFSPAPCSPCALRLALPGTIAAQTFISGMRQNAGKADDRVAGNQYRVLQQNGMILLVWPDHGRGVCRMPTLLIWI